MTLPAPNTTRFRFRPHHFLCALGYQGKGYNDAFTRNMDHIVRVGLQGSESDQVEIDVVAQTDAICGPCPHRRGVLCESQEKIEALDARHAAALGLQAGDQLSWGAAKARIRERVQPDDLGPLSAQAANGWSTACAKGPCAACTPQRSSRVYLGQSPPHPVGKSECQIGSRLRALASNTFARISACSWFYPL